MHYLDEGPQSGPPILFLHGNPTWSFMYRNVIKKLSSTNRCIAPDHIGCGLSDKPNEKQFPYDLRAHSRNIRDLLSHLSIDQFSMVVHDWGGAIGLTAFRQEIERLQKIVLLNTACFNPRDVPRRILFCRLPLIGTFFVRCFNGFAWPATFMGTSRGLSKQTKKGFLLPYDSWRNRVAVWRFVKDIPFEKKHPSSSLLKETEIRLKELKSKNILTCWGMKDFCFHPAFLNEWKRILPNIRSYESKNAGHYVLEDDLNGCMSRIEPFLSSME